MSRTGEASQSEELSDPVHLMQNLSNLSDDDFFARLTSLRAEHKKTLKHYEQLYHEKLMAEMNGDIGMIFGQPLFSSVRHSTDDTSVDREQDRDSRPESSLLVTGISLSARPPSPSAHATAKTSLSARKSPAGQKSPPRKSPSPPGHESPPHGLESPPPEHESPLVEDDEITAQAEHILPADENTTYNPLLEAPHLDTYGRDYQLSLTEPINTGGDTFNQSLDIIRRSAEKPPLAASRGRPTCPVHSRTKKAWTDQSKEEYWRTAVRESSDDDDDCYDERKYAVSRDHDAVLSRIGTMWDDFSISDYTPRYVSRSARSQSAERGARRERPRSAGHTDTRNWRHRITMPQPFQMTLREEAKGAPKSRTMLEYEHQKAMEQLSERFECEKKFRAAPVPAHVYLPLYDELMEKAETKRRTNVQVAKKVLKSQENPFKFTRREENRRFTEPHERRHSAPQVQRQKQFKARPIPKAVKADVAEQILEEEEYRKIRIRMRAKEMLRASSLPPSMASRNQDYTVGRLKEKLKEEKERASMYEKSSKSKFTPRIKRKVPDFDAIHRKQQKDSLNRHKGKDTKVATVCKPFNLRSSSIPSNLDKVLDDMKKDESQLKENRWPYKNPRAKPKFGEKFREIIWGKRNYLCKNGPCNLNSCIFVPFFFSFSFEVQF